MPQTKVVRALIADDYPFFRLGLRVFLEEQGDVSVVGEAATAHELVERVRSLQPEVILIDLDLPDAGGIAILEELRQLSPASRFVILSRWDDEVHLAAALKEGVEGFVLKNADPQVIILAIRSVSRGERWLQREMTGKLLQEYSRMASGKREAEGVLSPREMEVLKLLALGHRNSEIAYQLFISERTVKAHVSNLLRKLQLSDRMQAAHYAIRNGLIRV